MHKKHITVIAVLAIVCAIAFSLSCASAADTVGTVSPFAPSPASSGTNAFSNRIITDSTMITAGEDIDGVNINNPTDCFGLSISGMADEPVNVNILGDFLLTANRKNNPDALWALDLWDYTNTHLNNIVCSITELPDLGNEDIAAVNSINASFHMKDLNLNVSSDPGYSDGTYKVSGLSSNIKNSNKKHIINTGELDVSSIAGSNCETLNLAALEFSVSTYNTLPWEATIRADGDINAAGTAKNGDVTVYSIFANDYADHRYKAQPGTLDMKTSGNLNAQAETGKGKASAYGAYIKFLPGLFHTGQVTAYSKSDNIAEAVGLLLSSNLNMDKSLDVTINGPVTVTAVGGNASEKGEGGASAYAVWASDIDYDAYVDLMINGDVTSTAINHALFGSESNAADASSAVTLVGNHTNAVVNGNVSTVGISPFIYTYGVSAEEGAQATINGNVSVYAEGKEAEAIGVMASNYETDERTTVVKAQDVTVNVNSEKPNPVSFGIFALGPSDIQVRNLTVSGDTGVRMDNVSKVSISDKLFSDMGFTDGPAVSMLLTDQKPVSTQGLKIGSTVIGKDGILLSINDDDPDANSDRTEYLPEIHIGELFSYDPLSKLITGEISGKPISPETAKKIADKIQIDTARYTFGWENGDHYTINVDTKNLDYYPENDVYSGIPGKTVDFRVDTELGYACNSVNAGDYAEAVQGDDEGWYYVTVRTEGGVYITVKLSKTVYAALFKYYFYGMDPETKERIYWICTKVDHGKAKLLCLNGFEEVPDNLIDDYFSAEEKENILSDGYYLDPELSEKYFADGLKHPAIEVNVFYIGY